MGTLAILETESLCDGKRAYLDRAVVDQETVKGVVRLGSTIGVVEGDVGNTAAGASGPVRKFHPLDLSNSLLEVFLSQGSSWLALCASFSMVVSVAVRSQNGQS